MKAVLRREYGSPDVISIEETAQPVPRSREVLIKVMATSVNAIDAVALRGEPYLVRLFTGIARPRDPRLGADVAGEVVAIGRDVTRFGIGDQVFGSCRGAFAQYACASVAEIAHKPANVSFEQAGCAYVGAVTALRSVRDVARVQAGQSVLVNGAAGGVGTFVVQIAKAYGAAVTGVCSGSNAQTVLSIGAQRVVDYTQENFTTLDQRYDAIIDMAGNHPLAAYARILNPGGVCVVVGSPRLHGEWLGAFKAIIKVPLFSLSASGRFALVLGLPKQEHLLTVRELLGSGKIRAIIDRRYALNDAAQALRHLETGHARGKIAIAVS